MKRNQILVLLLYLLIGCHNGSLRQKNNDINKITFASEDYMRHGPFLAIEIDSSLKLKYYGGRNSNPEGFYYGSISNELWDSIKSKLIKINYQNLDSVYPVMVDDRTVEMFIHRDSNVKHITANPTRISKDVIKCFDEIINTYKDINLKKTNDSLTFETNIQVFYQPPIEHNIKFEGPK
jgi:hypothetical protein